MIWVVGMEREKTKPVALFIGRFQPLHLGHFAALQWIAKKSSEVIIAIGSSQLSHDIENPFTADERERMASAAVKEAGISQKCRIVKLEDVKDNDEWVKHVEKHVGKYDLVYSNNVLIKRLMEKGGKKVVSVPFFRREKYIGTKIREKMALGNEWESSVPKSVLLILKEIGAQERIRKLKS